MKDKNDRRSRIYTSIILYINIIFFKQPMMLVTESHWVLSMLTTLCQYKKVIHSAWDYYQTQLEFSMAVFNVQVSWEDFHPDPDSFVHLSITSFSL